MEASIEDGAYGYRQRGLLFIVYEGVDTGMGTATVEDSRWESEEKAKEHCRLLNELVESWKREQQRNENH